MNDYVCPVCQSPLDVQENVCPTCHFNLAGATQSFKPLSTDGNQNKANAAQDRNVSYLKMARGPKIGTVYVLNSDRTTIGRNPKCDIFLNDMTVSRLHAEIVREYDAFIINDLKSFNGVWINNRTIGSHALRPGDYLQIGRFDFVYGEDSGSQGDFQ